MLAVLAPSKSMDFTSNFIKAGVERKPPFISKSTELVNYMRGVDVYKMMSLMKIKEKLAEDTVKRFADFSSGKEKYRVKPAIHAFMGGAYKGLRAEDFSMDDLLAAEDRVRILSGLYGILTPLTEIEPYRLEMGLKLRQVGKLSQYWKADVTDSLNRALETHSNKILVNLASREYFAVVDSNKLEGEILDIVFKVRRNGVLKVVSVSAKKARGMMTSFMIRNRVEHPEELESFSEDGYRLVPELSERGTMTFVKEDVDLRPKSC